MIKFYIVRLGGGLYVSSKMYGLFQETTNVIENATKFKTIEQANMCLKKTIGGEVIPYVMMSETEYETEKETMQSTITSLTKQVENIKENKEKYIKKITEKNEK